MSDSLDLTSLITGNNLILAGGTFAIMATLRKSFKDFFATTFGQRVLPILPLLIAIGGALGGVCDGVTTWQDKVMLGCICGFAAGHLFKLGRTSLLGIGVDDSSKDDSNGSPPPAAGGSSPPAAPGGESAKSTK